jgi:hypothetical protein
MIRMFTLLLTLSSTAYLGLASSSIVINEVELNPPGEGRIAESAPWVELYNTEYEEVDISGWSLSTPGGIETTIPSDTSVPAYGYYIVTQRMQWLMTSNETLVLKDSQGREVDRTHPDRKSLQPARIGQHPFWKFPKPSSFRASLCT